MATKKVYGLLPPHISRHRGTHSYEYPEIQFSEFSFNGHFICTSRDYIILHRHHHATRGVPKRLIILIIFKSKQIYCIRKLFNSGFHNN
jgi:hypothetical protein